MVSRREAQAAYGSMAAGETRSDDAAGEVGSIRVGWLKRSGLCCELPTPRRCSNVLCESWYGVVEGNWLRSEREEGKH
jgi:hypothetical protein